MSAHPPSFFVLPEGASFRVDEPVAWCLEHARHPLLEPARRRLLLSDCRTDPDRVLNVVLRRCGLNLATVLPGRVVVHHWTQLVDLRPFFKEHALARPEVQVALVRRKNGLVTLLPADDFLSGTRFAPAFPFDAYRERWDRRHECQSDDHAPAPWSWSSYSWEGVEAGRIPWAALKSAWRREPAPDCPNCGGTLAVWRFDWRRASWLSSTRTEVLRCCFPCRRSFEESLHGDPWPWLARTLGPEVLPSWHDGGFGKADLRPRWAAVRDRPPQGEGRKSGRREEVMTENSDDHRG
jgi:hypothetical protein